MRPDTDEYHFVSSLHEDCSVITGDVDASAVGVCFFDGMIIEKWIEWIIEQKILPLNKFKTHIFWKFLEILQKRTMY
jgi:hypothetical protein